MNYEALADILFPNIKTSAEFYIEKYPERDLSEGSIVCRYAPSPTGFQHIGGVFAALINERLATQSNGVFYLRIEDTDQKREVEGAIEDTIKTMKNFGINFSEGMISETEEIGNYGPYRQSKRIDIYQTFAKKLVSKGLAYPCFCSEEEISAIREEQTSIKATPGYYGKWAKCRENSFEDIKSHVDNGDKFILRLKSPGNIEKRVEFHDLIKGDISFPENDQDIVIIKSDGLPTYHFAHAIDDALMRTTHVIRGEEWLSSLPIHVQLFDILGFKRPNYAHIPTIMKLDGSSKRKLSKRKDAESAVSYYREEGYPMVSVIEYLLNIINSSFEEWRNENPEASYEDFKVELEKMSKSGALFDIVKLNDVSKNVICKMKPDVVYDYYINWSKDYDSEMYNLVTSNEENCKKIFNIDKEGPKPRKDYAKWNDVREKVFFFFDELFQKDSIDNLELPKNMELDEAKRVIEEYAKAYNFNDDKDTWFENLKTIAVELGYATDRKAYKKEPEAFKGMVSDVAGAVRSALAHRNNTPDLHTIMQIMGEEIVRDRFNKFISL
ncbi:glutamate--tRNA ligase [Clostridium cylindrosporum]|uniref:Glutamate--tRNA ligase n=1 Tax=Clostridium cylindrosporum DSM 605 TaxID=1121307 RepID=A0A0J8D8G0_CLOCY|nr:glutamate--tRNA ligase [Clostridium cylindrosporum]KMT22345.1 glutamate--tRNA ligase GltX [Clostridium cylindrosporum DSM 605]